MGVEVQNNGINVNKVQNKIAGGKKTQAMENMEDNA